MAKVALIDTMHPIFRFCTPKGHFCTPEVYFAPHFEVLHPTSRGCTPRGKVELENLEITSRPV